MGGSGMVQRLGTTRGYTLVEMLMVVAIGLTLTCAMVATGCARVSDVNKSLLQLG